MLLQLDNLVPIMALLTQSEVLHPKLQQRICFDCLEEPGPAISQIIIFRSLVFWDSLKKKKNSRPQNYEKSMVRFDSYQLMKIDFFT